MVEDKRESDDSAAAAVVYATFPNETEALAVGEALVTSGLVACANVGPAITSVYIWDDKLQREQEVAMLMKTRRALAEQVVAEVRRRHSYQNPAVLVFDIALGSAPFLAWIAEQTSDKV